MTAKIRINISDVVQKWEGFGVSGAWWAQIIGECDQKTKDRILDALFDRQKGIGLTIYRYNIGGGDNHSIQDKWRRTESFEVDRGVYDWQRDSAAVEIMRGAVDRGVEKIVVFANTPTVRMTVSNRVDGHLKGHSNLEMAMVDDFVTYLIDVADFLTSEGFPVCEISPINEPQWDWQPKKGQEGCHYSPAECAQVVEKLLKKIEMEQKNYKVAAVDSGDWRKSRQYIDALFENVYIKNHLDAFHLHSYWSDAVDKRRIRTYMDKKYPDIRLEMSEWTQMDQGRDCSMASGISMARVIYEDLTIGNVVSWQYWIGVSKYDFTDGLIYTDFDSEEDISPDIIETKRLFVLGQYARFIRPGSVRIELDGDFKFLKPVAFLTPEENLVVVVLNDSPYPTDVDFDVTGYNIKCVVFTDKQNNLTVEESEGYTTCREKSVTTFLLKK